MMDFLRKYKTVIYAITVFGFLSSIIFGLGAHFFGKTGLYENVATVNGTKISYKHFNSMLGRILDEARNNGTELTEDMIQQEKIKTLQQLIQQEVLYQQSKKLGILVSDAELAGNIQSYPVFQKDGQFNQMIYIQTLIQRLRMTPEEFEEDQRKQIAGYKLRNFISSTYNFDDQEINKAYEDQYKAKPQDLAKELKALEVPDKELEDAYKKEHNGSSDNFKKEKASYLITYKQKKHKDNFIRAYKNKFLNQFFSDWAQKITAEVKVKTYLDEIEKMERGEEPGKKQKTKTPDTNSQK
jgi:peptidyl-prolyl cis-trans isomerase D